MKRSMAFIFGLASAFLVSTHASYAVAASVKSSTKQTSVQSAGSAESLEGFNSNANVQVVSDKAGRSYYVVPVDSSNVSVDGAVTNISVSSEIIPGGPGSGQ